MSAPAVVLRPRQPHEIADLALAWCCRAAWPLNLRLGLALLAPPLLLCLTLALVGVHPALVWLLASVSTTLAQGAFTTAASMWIFDPRVTPKAALARFRQRLSAFIRLMIWTRFVMVLTAPLMVTLPVAAVRYAFASEACLLEGASTHVATARARRLNANASGRLGGWLVLHFFTLLLCLLAADALVGALTQHVLQIGSIAEWRVHGWSPGALVGWFLAAPLCSATRFFTYLDERTRQDGWDLQVRFMKLKETS
ncbi:hypothetical protein KKF91_15750 [Myxococcota bacterium]|nr:hypothetical protein [Myxococcota bacterium]MBU1431995.1 hypothetical protein [Myxococcota bacterium]MBU1897033.1 hypothetical protein [Myxococcota bacterium]